MDKSIRVWMASYMPHVYPLFTNSYTLEEKKNTWNLISKYMELGETVENLESEGELLRHIYTTVDSHYYAYLSIGMINMMSIHGYTNASYRRGGGTGSYSDIMNIYTHKGYNVYDIGKVIYTSDTHDKYDSLGGMCYNEAIISVQMKNRYINTCKDVITCGNPVKQLSLGKICFVQERKRADLGIALKTSSLLDMSIDGIINIILSITEGIANLHQSQFLHLDLKPYNILVDSKGGVCITDFGLSYRHTTQYLSDTNKITAWYRPPEMILSGYGGKGVHLGNVGTHSDVWSLGMCIWDLFCDRPLISKTKGSCIWEMLTAIIHFNGFPTPSDFESWKLSPRLIDKFNYKLRDMINIRKQSLYQLSKSVWRKSTKKLPRKFLTKVFKILESIFHYNTDMRPTAKKVWSEFSKLTNQDDISLYVPLDEPLDISDEEKAWRIGNITRSSLCNYWEFTTECLTWLLNVTCKNENIPKYKGNESIYLDIVILSCELFLRMKYIGNMSTYTESEIMFSCFALASQITRPWWNIANLRNCNISSMRQQAIELYVATTLKFKLYLENVLTEQKRLHVDEQLEYSKIRDLFFERNSLQH